MTRPLPTTTSQATDDQSSSYPQQQRTIRWKTKLWIYITKERRYKTLSTKEDRQPRNDFRFSSSQVTTQYGTYAASPATKTTSTIINGKGDKRLQFQVNWLNIARDTSIKAWTKNSSQNFEFFIPSITLTLP